MICALLTTSKFHAPFCFVFFMGALVIHDLRAVEPPRRRDPRPVEGTHPTHLGQDSSTAAYYLYHPNHGARIAIYQMGKNGLRQKAKGV